MEKTTVMDKTKSSAPNRRYSQEEKVSIVRQVLEEHVKQEELVRQTGIPRSNIHKWVGQARRGELVGYTAKTLESKSTDMVAEVKRLERELVETRLERDFLKKVSAYFAKEKRLGLR